MEDKINNYIKSLVLIRKSHKQHSKISEKKGDLGLMAYHNNKASTLKVVIADLREIVKGERHEQNQSSAEK